MYLHRVHVEGEEAEEGQQVSGAQVKDSLSPVWVLGTKPVSSAEPPVLPITRHISPALDCLFLKG